MKAVYTGIDSMNDAPLIMTETAFATGFGTTMMKANGAVYGAHGAPGWIQGLPDSNGTTILQQTFGMGNIPWLGLSVCYAGNTGAHASTGQLTDTPSTYQNNIAAAPFITTYFSIPSSAIIACKNGEVRPSQGVLWCGQHKYQRDGWPAARLLGNATLIQGDGTERGNATTKATANDATGDFSVTMQAAMPTRFYKARNLPTNRMQRDRATNQFPEPWNLAPRCACSANICTAQDNYPAV
ncbi:MAG: hypothetical protein E6J90_22245, partial [Deltaproteobacteria bacterium]